MPNNSKTVPYLWALTIASILPALIFAKATHILMCSFLVLTIIYIWLYKKMIRFKTPTWLMYK